jgi:hypothetical protein
MSLLKVPRLGRRRSAVSCQRIGESFVAHGPNGMTAQARELASSLLADPEYALVVVDLSVAESSPRHWEAIAKAVEVEGQVVRLLPSEAAGELGLAAAQWLSNRLGRTVLYPDGVMQLGVGGRVFLPSLRSKGWGVCSPEGEPVWQGRRLPVPEWEGPATSNPHRVGKSATAEPLPSGVWIRSDGPERWLDAGRTRLARWLCVWPREVTVVLGGHGVPPLTLEDVATWWAAVSPDTRVKTRFLCYGEIATPAGIAPGQALADALGEEVVCHGGLPTGTPEAPDVFALRQDGSHGFRIFAEQIAFRPRHDLKAEPDAPQIRHCRRPFDGLTEVGPGVYRHESELIVEVVQAGLWIRSAREPARAAEVRTMPSDATAFLLFHDPADALQSALVLEVLDRVDASLRAAARPIPVASPAEDQGTVFGADLTMPLTPLPRLSKLLKRHSEQKSATAPLAPEPGPSAGDACSEAEDGTAVREDAVDVTTKVRHPVAKTSPKREVPEVVAEPVKSSWLAPLEPKNGASLKEEAAAVTTKIRHPAVKTPPVPVDLAETETETVESAVPQPVPELGSRAWPLPPGFIAEREMVRAGREDEFDALSDRIATVLRRFSPQRAGSDTSLTEAVAAGLYLAGHDPDVDAGLRSSAAGTNVAFGRCVAAGLQKLPLYRKAAATVVSPGPELWETLRTQTVLREWGFLNLRTVRGPAESGSADLIVWSTTGRLTASIEPTEEGVADRVVFLPGTAFKVLEVIEPDANARGRILLREMAVSEVDEDRAKATGNDARDNLVRASLRRFADGTAERTSEHLPAAQLRKFGRVPGIAEAPKRRGDL